jgi:transcriptional regulator with XRE-family HTH domain
MQDYAAWQERYRQWIELICETDSVTATEIAKRIGASPSTITRQIKPGWTRKPSLDVLRRISTIFKVSIPPELIGGTETQNFVEPDVNPLKPEFDSAESWNTNLSDWTVRSHSLAAMGCIPGDYIRCDASITPVSGDIVLAQIFRIGQSGADTVMRLYMPPFLVAAELGSPTIAPINIDTSGRLMAIIGTMIKRWSLRKTRVN